MSNRCKYCGLEIFFVSINGKTKAFDDQTAMQLHRCEKYKKSKSISERLTEIEDYLRLLSSRVESHSERIEKLEKIYDTK